MPNFNKRLYRVQGDRPDGTIHTRDYFSLTRAEVAASALLKSRMVGGKVLHPLANVRVIRSAPIRWLHDEPKDTP
jgi:hypothetical protein